MIALKAFVYKALAVTPTASNVAIVWASCVSTWRNQMENVNDSEQIEPIMRTCPKCKDTKPLALFRYTLTRAQAKQQGYAGKHLVIAEGKVCKACRPKRKPLHKMTNKELVQKASTGDVHPLIAKVRIEKNKHDANLLRRAGRVNRWEEIWAQEWDDVLTPMKAHLRKQNQVKRLAKLYGRKSKYAFLDFYTSTLRKELARLTLHYKTQLCRAPYTRWEEYIPKEVRDKLDEAWLAMPFEERLRMRGKPDMVNYLYDPDKYLRKQVKNTDALAARKALLGKPEKIPRPVNPAPRISPYPKLETGHTPKTRLLQGEAVPLLREQPTKEEPWWDEDLPE